MCPCMSATFTKCVETGDGTISLEDFRQEPTGMQIDYVIFLRILNYFIYSLFSLKMEAGSSSETLVTLYKYTRLHIQE
jgi:hypothetical protein